MTTDIKIVEDDRKHNKLMCFNFLMSLAMFKLATSCTVAQDNERFVGEEKDLGVAVGRT